jgi:WD40 repeat protein
MDGSSAHSTDIGDSKSSRPWLSLLVSILLWLLAWEVIVWFVPIQPRLVVAAHDEETEESEYLMGFSPDCKTLVTVMEPDPNEPGQIYRLWDVNTGQDLGTLGSREKTILPNVVYVSQRDLVSEIVFPLKPAIDRTYTLYDLTTRRETASIEVKRGDDETHLCFSPDGSRMAYSKYWNHKGELQLLDVATGRVLTRLEGPEYGYFARLVFSENSETLVTGAVKTKPGGKLADDEKVLVVDAITGKTRGFPYARSCAHHLALSPDGTRLALGCWNAGHWGAQVWDLEAGKQKGSFADGFDEFLPDGRGFMNWDQERVTFFDLETGNQFAATDVSNATFWHDMGGLGGPVPIPGTHLLAVPSGNNWKPSLFYQWCARLLGRKSPGKPEFDSQLLFLDTRTGHKVAGIELPFVNGAISPDGKTLALPITESEDSTIEIWDIPPRKPLRWMLAVLAIPGVVTLMTLWKCWKARSTNR